jgi:DNA-directed RNA polymerase subunit M/transcription elongation factor TFIIS
MDPVKREETLNTLNNLNIYQNNKKTKAMKECTKHMKEIEEGIYEWSKKYAADNDTPFLIEYIYDTKLAEIIEALTDNEDLIKNTKVPYDLAFLCPDELNPKKYDSIIKKKEINEYKKNDIKAASAFTCSKCKNNKCSVSQKQILAGDEPLTTFVTCLVCDFSFSFH